MQITSSKGFIQRAHGNSNLPQQGLSRRFIAAMQQDKRDHRQAHNAAPGNTHAFRMGGTFLQQQEQSAASSTEQQASDHFRDGMRMDDQPRIPHHGGQNIAGGDGCFLQTRGETGTEQP